MSEKKIKDAGEIIPNAKKHNVKERKKSESEISLPQLFPEPDWSDYLKKGYSIEAICFLTAVYIGIRKKPRVYTFKDINIGQWESSYIRTINELIKLFSITKTADDVKQFKDRFNLNMGFPEIEGLSFNQYYPLFAAGRGENRTIYRTLSFTNRQDCLIDWLPKLDWPFNKKAIKVKHFPIEFDDGSWILCKPTSKGFSYHRDDVYQTYDDAVEAFYKKIDEKTPSAFNPKKKKFDLDQKGVIKTDVTGDDIIYTFGFRAVQFGRSLSDKERQLWLNNIYYALDVFCRILNFPNKKWLGLGGVGIAFGARGHGPALAHYEPDLQAFYLTRSSGPFS